MPTLATVSGADLKEAMQTKEFAENWHQELHKLWQAQTHVGQEIHGELQVTRQGMYW